MSKKKRSIALAWLLVLSMVLPMFSSAIPTMATETSVSAENNFDAMTIEQILSQDKSITWVFAGDSITHNAGWSGGMNSYSEWFEQYLYDIGRGDDAVLLSAWGGANTYDFQYYEKTPEGYGPKVDAGKGLENMITKYNPDVVFLKLGMNERKKATENIVRTYKQILDGVYAEGLKNNKVPKIVLLSSTPVSDETFYDDQIHTESRDRAIVGSVKRSRDEIEKIATEYDLTFVDLRTAFIEEALRLGEDYSRTFYSDSSDGTIHPNAAGQYYIFKTLSKAIGIYKEDMPIFQLKYEDILSQAMYVDDTLISDYSGEYGSTDGWSTVFTENYVWGVAGAQQMSGYEGPVPHRSMFRFIDNALRYNEYRDIRVYNFASPAYTNGVADLLEKYDKTMATRTYDVFLLLPEVPKVYESTYVHSDTLVEEYKANVLELLEKNSGKTCILWTPLASGDGTMNGYISAYAEAVREIATADSTILFFDANKFMNDNMTGNTSLVNNWFEDGVYVSPLCADDVVFAFYTLMNQTGTGMNALKNRNLRYTSDTQVFKGNYVRDYIKADATVSGTTVTVDVSAIKTAYPNITNLRLMVLPEKATGNYHGDIRLLSEVATVSEVDNTYTFEAPCANLYLAIYGEQNGLIYRFKDISLTVDTTATIPEKTTPVPTGVYLDSLKVMSAPDFGFEKDTTSYNVNLYQYQTYATVRATAQVGLTITVNGETVASNALSKPIKVESGSKIEVAVTDGTTTKTYTLTCVKPQQPDIIITEVMQDAYASYTVANSNDNYELVEIYNASGRDLNLLDYSLGFKKDYTYNNVTESNSAEYPYYFTGNDQSFGGDASYTGIKPITKYSVYWTDKVESEPPEVTFKADSTMVIWIRSTPQSTEEARAEHGATLTYETLRAALEAHKGTHTLTVNVDGVETAVVPQESQLVVAEVTQNVKSAVLTNRAKKTAEVADTTQNYVMDNFTGIYNADTATRGWLFMLKNTAEFARNGAITEAGNDIVTAAKFYRVGKEVDSTVVGTDKLSSVLSYNYERGMSVVRNENVVNVDTIGVGNTSDVMGYSNLTSFGAIEYWQKPLDFGDTTAPVIVDKTDRNLENAENDSIAIDLALSDEQDLRYIELYVRKDGETEFTKVSKDYVLETGVKNAGLTEDIQSAEYSYTVTEMGELVEYYVKAVDGNNNVTTLGSEEEPLSITTLRIVEPYTAEKAKEHIGKQENIPTCATAGYIFAGWYEDEACEKSPITDASQVKETVYALFVSKTVLGVKAQLSADVLTDDVTTGTANLRFVTTVDSLRYKEAGFKFVIYGTTSKVPTDVVYKKLYALNKDGTEDQLLPKMFSAISNYFWAVTVTGIPSTAWDASIAVTPYWTTLDGVTVEGEEVTKTVNQGRNDSVARIGTSYYNTVAEAVEAAVDNDTVEVLRDTTVDTAMTIDKNITIANAIGSTATLTRAESLTGAMFTVTSEGNLTIASAGANTITVDGNNANVTATDSMIVNAGTFTLGENASLINGGNEDLKFGGALSSTGTAILGGNISGHTAQNGGAIYSYGNGTVTFNGGVLQNNTATARGGVIYGTGTSETIVTAGEFAENTATGTIGGGAISIAGNASLNVSGGDFHDNEATSTSTSAYGGGAIESNGDVTISGGIFESNSALNGGVIYMDSSCNAIITAGTFGSQNKGNTAENSGGVIYLKKSSTAGAKVTIEGGTFAYNEAAGTTGGGAIAGAALTTVDIQGGTFSNNSATSTATDAYGGGAIETNGTLTISDGTFDTNTAFKGGAVYVDVDGQLTISNGEFLNNSTSQLAGTQGGAIYNAGNNLTITGGTFGKEEQGNTAYYRGGAITIDSNTCLIANISGASFMDNSIAGKKQTYSGGGALYITGTKAGTSVVNLTNCTFSGNTVTSTTANYGFGGSIYNSYAYTLNITGSTFTGGDAYYGGVIYLNYQTSDTGKSNMTLKNCAFSNNAAYTCADIYANRGNVYLSGKVTSMIGLNQGYTYSKLYVNESLDAESSVEIRVVTSTKTRVVVDFANDDLMTECQNNNIFYLYDDDTSHANYTLSFSNKKATVVAKE